MQTPSAGKIGRTDADYAKAFAKALEMETPCDDCAMALRCALHKMACDQFYRFVMAGDIDEDRSRVPNRQIFDDLFSDEEKLEKVA